MVSGLKFCFFLDIQNFFLLCSYIITLDNGNYTTKYEKENDSKFSFQMWLKRIICINK